MDDTTRQILIRRVRMLRKQLRPLLDDLADAERAAAALGVSSDELEESSDQSPVAEPAGPTMKEMSVESLREDFPDGATCAELVTHFEKRYGRKVDRASLSPQLGRLKKVGLVDLDGIVWTLRSGEAVR